MASTPFLSSNINLGLPSTPPDGLKDPEVIELYRKVIALSNSLLNSLEQYTGITQKDPSLWSVLAPTDTILRSLQGRLYVKFSEACNFGDFVALHNVAGVLNARKSNATAGTVRPARGYCSTEGGVLIGAFGEIILSQGLLAIGGISPGDAIYLSTAAGAASLVPATGAGQLEQFLGVGVATNLAYIDIALGSYIQH